MAWKVEEIDFKIYSILISSKLSKLLTRVIHSMTNLESPKTCRECILHSKQNLEDPKPYDIQQDYLVQSACSLAYHIMLTGKIKKEANTIEIELNLTHSIKAPLVVHVVVVDDFHRS
jgi:hypothetical protein